MRVLVVEDEFLIAMEVESLLTEAGHEVVGPVADIEEALGLIAKQPIDAAVLDVNLGDGATSARLAAELVRQRIGFVLSTGYRQQDLATVYGTDVTVIQKPIDGQRLLDALSRLPARGCN
ncbi:response regulator receiver domain-containing protein [Tepidamorphus gemmatus]|uniref:Response regulator receiver domain-containing protein n=1 Tax=Tepidamorphus gemmatus TaxID=747076 RepID=A0A4R3MAN7_9HYPH|nr:response regulator [Tepidamorphus gemmatus]TCT10651.1 response regulator receiver domain-containing protein [Tepidamorphus gemmatus]